MLHVILFRPEIAPNTGNAIRLCANTGATLHLIRPLGFELDDKRMRRAGLDYHDYARMQVHDSLDHCLRQIETNRVFAFSTRGTVRHVDARYMEGDALLFGCETAGLPAEVLEGIAPEHRLRLPMQPHSRSLNLSNTVAVAVYEAWRQLGFAGST